MHWYPSRLLSSAAALMACALLLISSLPAAAQEPPATAIPAPVISVLVELMGEPAAALYARAQRGAAAADTQAIAAATQAQVAAVAAEQQAMQAALASLGAHPLYAAQRVYNGIAVRIAADQLDALRALPGVRAVTPLVAKQPDNARSIPFLGVPTLWAGVEGVAARGEGTTIAIIDTGIDYSHTDFGGLGNRAPANDPTDGNDHPDFPSAKVIGGYDFVGDSYNANPQHPDYQPEPQPDADPLDCFGHGTHVSGTAAGYGVAADGYQFAGPWDSSTEFASLAIGPGVAPLAQIYALKVFGCAGSSDIVDLALEWATDPNQDGDFSDHVDVINLSLGSAFGSTGDTTSRAAAAAVEVGVIVVASAGNNGDVAYAVGSPGVAESVLSVAATQIDPAPSGAAGSLTDLPASFTSRGPADEGHLKPDLAAPGVDISSARNGSGSGSLTLSGTSMAAPQVAGAMALLRQLRPGWSAAELKALVMNTAAPVVRAGAAYTSTILQPARVGSGRIDVGNALRSPAIAFDAAHPDRVSLSFGVVEVAGSRVEQGTVSVVNRSGAAITYRLLYQPLGDIAGVDLALPGPPTITVAAGSAQSLPLQLKADAAAIRNGRDATMGIFPGLPHAWQNEESGLLWLWPEPALFTATVGGATLAADFDLPGRTLRTRLDADATLAAKVTEIALHRGLPGFADAAPAYTLYARGGGPVPAFPLTGTVTLAEEDLPLLASGALQLVVRTGDTPGAAEGAALVAATPPLKLAVHAAVRAASEMRAPLPALEMGATGAATRPLPLAGIPLTATVTPTGTQSLVSLLELHARSPRGSASLLPPIPGEIDFQFVGIGSDVGAAGSLAEARVFFGVSVYEPWSTPGTVRFSFFIDSTGDDVPDYRVFTTNQLALEGGTQASDLFVTGVETLATSAVVEADPLNALSPNDAYTAIFNSRVMVVSVPARLLGIGQGRTRLTIRPQSARVGGESNWTGDRTGVLVYDLARPGLELSNDQAGSPLFPDRPGADLEVGFDLYGYSRSTARGLLLLHHHNAGAQQAEAVTIRFQWPHVRLLPLIENGAPPN